MNDRKTASNVTGLTSNVNLEVGKKQAPEPTAQQGPASSKNLHEGESESVDCVFVSPTKAPRETQEKGSLKLNQLLVKRSPTSVLQFDAQEASSAFEGKLPREQQSTLPQIFCLNMGSPAKASSDRENCDECNIDDDPSVGIHSNTSDLTTSITEGAAPKTPSGQVLKKPICSKPELYTSFTTQTSGDSSPRKPRRAMSPKIRRRASFGSAQRHQEVPHMITCLPPDSSPMKPSRKKSNDGLQRDLRKSCPEMFSLRKAFAMAQMPDETSTSSDPHEICTVVAQDASPTKPSRKKSKNASPTELISLQEALAISLSDTEDEEFRMATPPIQTSSRCLSKEASLPPTKPTRKSSIGTDFD